jgi:hypothetical protein
METLRPNPILLSHKFTAHCKALDVLRRIAAGDYSGHIQLKGHPADGGSGQLSKRESRCHSRRSTGQQGSIEYADGLRWVRPKRQAQ